MASPIATTVQQTVTETVAASATPTSTSRAASQGGILEGGNPTHYNTKDPIILFIIQAGIIIIFCRLLHWPLQKLKQPRVIAEVIGGILLGPSVMGRIPHFTTTIFPSAAMPNLTLVANLGLLLFLFLVGLEVDLRYLVSNWKTAASVGFAGMALPFGLGCAIAWGLYHEFANEPGTVPISFGVFMLFIGVAMAITAFPVLCRILTELKLLHTSVGIIVLSAGVGNDVVGWVLLALCVALVNAGTGLTALWVLLTCTAWILFMVYAVRPLFIAHLRRTRSLENGPSQTVIVLTLLIALTSAFFTGVIGVHPIFGAFLAGLICPHEGGFAIKVTEKIEDLVSSLFLPLYFALSGLNTNLGLLDSGITWAYVIGVLAVAFFAKVIGATIAARLNGLVWRECLTIGALMSCKGLVELIVLNIGLNAKILSTRTFTIFVVMALVTTFATTPLTAVLYPPEYQRKIEAWKRGEIDWDTGKPLSEESSSNRDSLMYEKMENNKIHRMLVYLRLDNMPPLMAFVALLGNTPQARHAIVHPSRAIQGGDEPIGPSISNKRPIEAHGVHLLELTERASSVMQVSELDEYSMHDPLVNTFRTVGHMHNLAVSGEVTVLPETSFSEALTTKAIGQESDFLLLPWSETGSMSETQQISSASASNKLGTSSYISFISSAFQSTPCNTAVFINRNFGGASAPKSSEKPGLFRTRSAISIHSSRQHLSAPVTDRSHHIFLPYFGGADDRFALRLVLQMAENEEVTATIVHFETDPTFFATAVHDEEEVPTAVKTGTGLSMTGGKKSVVVDVASSTTPAERDTTFFSSLKASIPVALAARVVFETVHVGSKPLESVLARAGREVGQAPKNAGDLVVVGRNTAWVDSFAREAQASVSESSRCLGVVGKEVASGGLGGSVLVVQAQSCG
ncbi:hypothetical protein FKW77_010566 [Venturia effusa]|uniref:Cation/H+ exchanger transmembrane domain-containing protein n=1 Tax=Venturia effusa TaxID=50376 RepID=A0A517L0K5_9PEZI|nr:hypothetical protein FKW77_010566 [Venturia effusa]